MVAIRKPNGIKVKAFIDDTVGRMVGHRFFTNVVTDSTLRMVVKSAKKERGGRLGPSDAMLKGAALAYNNVRRTH